jgi:hypothetical protein
VAIVLFLCAVFAVTGLWVGSRLRAAKIDSVTTGACAESSIEVARLQERIVALEESSRLLRESLGAAQHTLKLTEERLALAIANEMRVAMTLTGTRRVTDINHTNLVPSPE